MLKNLTLKCKLQCNMRVSLCSLLLKIMVCEKVKILHSKKAKSCKMITTSTFKPKKIVDEKRQHEKAHSKPYFVRPKWSYKTTTRKEMQHDEKNK